MMSHNISEERKKERPYLFSLNEILDGDLNSALL